MRCKIKYSNDCVQQEKKGIAFLEEFLMRPPLFADRFSGANLPERLS